MPAIPGYLSEREERVPADEKAASRPGPMSTNDPIIAAIEAHRRACAETRGAYERQSAVEDELGAGVRVPTGEAENDQRWIIANNAAASALAVQDDLAVKLLETQPTTIAGAAALLTYYVDVIATTQAEVIFPDLDATGPHLSLSRPMDRGEISGIWSSAMSLRRSADGCYAVRLLTRRPIHRRRGGEQTKDRASHAWAIYWPASKNG